MASQPGVGQEGGNGEGRAEVDCRPGGENEGGVGVGVHKKDDDKRVGPGEKGGMEMVEDCMAVEEDEIGKTDAARASSLARASSTGRDGALSEWLDVGGEGGAGERRKTEGENGMGRRGEEECGMCSRSDSEEGRDVEEQGVGMTDDARSSSLSGIADRGVVRASDGMSFKERTKMGGEGAQGEQENHKGMGRTKGREEEDEDEDWQTRWRAVSRQEGTGSVAMEQPCRPERVRTSGLNQAELQHRE